MILVARKAKNFSKGVWTDSRRDSSSGKSAASGNQKRAAAKDSYLLNRLNHSAARRQCFGATASAIAHRGPSEFVFTTSGILIVQRRCRTIDHPIMLRDRHVDARASIRIREPDCLRHGVGIFAAMIHGLKAQTRPIEIRVLWPPIPRQQRKVSKQLHGSVPPRKTSAGRLLCSSQKAGVAGRRQYNASYRESAAAWILEIPGTSPCSLGALASGPTHRSDPAVRAREPLAASPLVSVLTFSCPGLTHSCPGNALRTLSIACPQFLKRSACGNLHM